MYHFLLHIRKKIYVNKPDFLPVFIPFHLPLTNVQLCGQKLEGIFHGPGNLRLEQIHQRFFLKGVFSIMDM